MIVDSVPGHVEVIEGAHGGVGVSRMRRLARHPDATFAVLDWEFPAGSTEGPHHHLGEPIGVEQYLVLAGEVTVVIDGARHPLTVGDSIAIAPSAVRELRNDSAGPARVLLVYERPPAGSAGGGPVPGV